MFAPSLAHESLGKIRVAILHDSEDAVRMAFGDLMRMAAVGYDVDVSGVDQTALACFLDSDFASGLRGKSLGGELGGQRGSAFKMAKAEMEKRKESEGDFMKMRMAAVGHTVDISGVDQTALAWFLSETIMDLIEQVRK